jgi:hypothetical protein
MNKIKEKPVATCNSQFSFSKKSVIISLALTLSRVHLFAESLEFDFDLCCTDDHLIQ